MPMNAATLPKSCPHCFGASVLRSRGGHDPACPLAQKFPVTATRPPIPEQEPET